MFAFLKYFVFLTFVIEEFYFNISFPQRYQWELGEWKWWPPFHKSKLSDNTQLLHDFANHVVSGYVYFTSY